MEVVIRGEAKEIADLIQRLQGQQRMGSRIYLVPLPRKVEGVAVSNNDGTFDVYINSVILH